MKKIGLFGGTFDPIHIGHLIAAEEVRIKLNLDEIIFIPAGHPWLKEGKREITPPSKRLEMVRLAVRGNPHFKVSSIEIEREGPSYSVDTVSFFRENLPNSELYFILGEDALIELPLWKEPQRLISLCRLAVVRRAGVSKVELEALEERIPGIKERAVFLETPLVEISSTEIRSRVACGLSIRYLVPREVEEFIRREGLYRS